MTAFKDGDRVRVVIEGTAETSPPSTHVKVHYETFDSRSRETAWFRQEDVEKIAEPVKVGDRVTEENVDSLPVGTVVVSYGGLAAQLRDGYENAEPEWFIASNTIMHSIESRSVWATWESTVVYLPEDES